PELAADVHRRAGNDRPADLELVQLPGHRDVGEQVAADYQRLEGAVDDGVGPGGPERAVHHHLADAALDVEAALRQRAAEDELADRVALAGAGGDVAGDALADGQVLDPGAGQQVAVQPAVDLDIA